MHRLQQRLYLRSLAPLALLLVLAQSALLWHQHDAAAHDHGASCEVCVHSSAAAGIDSPAKSLFAPLYMLQHRIAQSGHRAVSSTVLTAFQARAPPARLSI